MARSTACQATKQNGQPCGSVVVLASGYCFLHDPDRKEDARRISVKGGQGKRRIARVERLVPTTLRPVLASLLEALDETRRGEMDPKIAGALAALARVAPGAAASERERQEGRTRGGHEYGGPHGRRV